MKIEAHNTTLEAIEKVLIERGIIEYPLNWRDLKGTSECRFKPPFIDYRNELIKFIGKQGDILYLTREGDIVYCYNLEYTSLLYRMRHFFMHKEMLTYQVYSLDELMVRIDEKVKEGKTPYKITFNIVDGRIYCVLDSNTSKELAGDMIHSWLQKLANRKLFRDNLSFWI